MESIDPRPLFDRLNSGDGQAISVLVATHLPGMRSFVAGYAPTKALAANVLRRTWLRFTATFDATSLADPATRLHCLAKEELLTCLDGQLRRCMQGQDALAYGVVSRALDRLKSHDRGADDPVPAAKARVARLDDTQRDLLGRRYRDQLTLEALARVAATSDQAVATALFRTRATLADLGEAAATMTAQDRLFPTLVEDYLEGALSADARGMLARTIASNLDHLSLFEVQVRMDLVLDAALGGEDTLVAVVTEAMRAMLTSPRTSPQRTISDRQALARSAAVARQQTTPPSLTDRGHVWTWIGATIVGLAALLGLGAFIGMSGAPPRPGRTAATPLSDAARPAALPAAITNPPARTQPVQLTPAPPIAAVRVAAPRPLPGPPPPNGQERFPIPGTNVIVPEPAVSGVRGDPSLPIQTPGTEAPITRPAAMPGSTVGLRPGLRRERWSNIPHRNLSYLMSHPKYPDSPDEIAIEESAQSTLQGDNFGERLSGWLVPPVSGVYRFDMFGHDDCQFWLGLDDQPTSRRMLIIARHTNRTPVPSKPIRLDAGRHYYFEMLRKQETGKTFCVVGWSLPSGEHQVPIPGAHLVTRDSALPTTTAAVRPGFLLRERWNDVPGMQVSDLLRDPKFAQAPDDTAFEPAARSLVQGTHFGERLVGWLLPPVSGDYHFDYDSDDGTELWLGLDDQPTSRQRVLGPARGRVTTPTPLRLEAGRRYSIEILHKQAEDQTHCVVSWTLPTGERQSPIPGAALATVDRNPAPVRTAGPLAAPTRPGFLRRERWKSMPDINVNTLRTHLRFPDQPDEVDFEPTAHTTADGLDFGERLVGWLIPPTTGDYRFEFMSDDDGELWLSTDDRPDGLRKLAFDNAPKKTADIFIPVVALEAGRRYWIEVLHMQGNQKNYCTVGWTLPTGARQMPIPGAHLATCERDSRVAVSADRSGQPVAPLITRPHVVIERMPLPTKVNLTEVGVLDWSVWGQVASDPLQVIRKVGVKPAAHFELTGGASAVTRITDYPVPITWTDGDRETRGTSRRGAITTDGPDRGFLLTLPADRQVRELRLFVGGWNGSLRLDVGLEGEAPHPPDLVPAQAGRRGLYYVIRYAASVDGRSLRVRWIATSPGHAWLAAAAVGPAAP